MSFFKIEMQEELFKFLAQFGQQIAKLYGVKNCAFISEDTIKESPIWKAVNEMYDYGVMGIPSEDFYPEGHIDPVYGHIERFLRAIDTPQMKLYLEERSNTPPRLALLAVQSAVARMVLDGGWRHTDYAAGEYGVLKGDMNHLTLAEVALLAQMDERSVRNAANPKLPDPLKTEQIGKRSLVTPEEARRWLAGRKSYIPTQAYTGPRKPSTDITISLEQVQQAAEKSGLSVEQILTNLNAFINRS